MVITKYDLDQRILFFKALNFPGNHRKEAEKSLIDDRLKEKAAKKLGIKVNQQAIDYEMKKFAQLANLTTEQFAANLKKAGVDELTWESYMKIPVLWFKTINRKFYTKISDNKQKRQDASQKDVRSEAQVLLTEIIVPLKKGSEEETNLTVNMLREINSLEKFSEAAFKYSAAPTRELGGKITWQNISNLPAAVKPLVSGLSVGEVTEPLLIPGGVALFQLRDIRESKYKQKKVKFIDFIEISFPNNKKTKSFIKQNVFVCDDLYSFSKSTKNTELIRKNVKVGSLSKNFKSTLAELDENEFIFNDNNATSKLIMVCGRDKKENSSTSDVNEIERSDLNKRLFNLANSYLENLRQEAHIVFK
ncbi:MAG: hypothetical protein CBC71_00925 [Rhodobacteraceae bacterium TMED111]|nr:hypothetical protein [Marinovum sp.]OUV45072.1 MAG: hypothetical protein CBC71_00925 [Rhodobacteraceae bacterium TMED111]